MGPIETYEIVGLVASYVFSAFFSGSEAVLLSIDPNRTKQLIDEGGSIGNAINFMAERPNELLSTILVGNNVANIFAATLNGDIAARIFDSNAVGYSVTITTFIILIFGELVPKTIARVNAEKLAFPVIKVLQLCYYLMYPLVKAITVFMEKMLGENAQITGRLVTKKDIEFMVNKAEKEKTIDSKQIDLLHSILEFPTIKVKDIMIPRNQVKCIKAETSFKDLIHMIRVDTHSRYPVCELGDLDRTTGFLHVKDLAFVDNKDKESETFGVEKFLKSPFFVYEHMKIQAVFDHMNRKKVHLALVKDENGLVVGIVTLEDIVEEIFGEIQDEHDIDEDDVSQQYAEEDLAAGGIVVEGSMSIRDLYNEFDIKIPLNDNFSTVAGFILDMLGNNFPEEGQIIVWEGYSFELTKVEDFEIREVKIQDVDGEKHIFSKIDATDSTNDNE